MDYRNDGILTGSISC